VKAWYDGPIAPVNDVNVGYPTPIVYSNAEINTLGTRGFANSIPTQPQAQLAQALIELRDLPKLPLIHSLKEKGRAFRDLARKGGNEYLNVEFGWKPFVNDVRSATLATLKSKKSVSQFTKDSGKRVRRRRTLQDNGYTTTLSSISAGPFPNIYGMAYENQGTLRRVDSVKIKSWFVGCFTYYVSPVGQHWYSPSSIKRGEQIANHLYGTRLTPSLMWELAPWSWMADYFGNTGDILKNLSAFSNDNLVCHYGYLMTEATSVRSYIRTDATVKGGRGLPPSSITCTQVDKYRYRANPYSFSGSFSPTVKQGAILAALGLSRIPYGH
jgi:hypothetical protein